ncbi:succinyl-diaminopimelate desuccinylase [Methyloceanibacter caenitepidi]|uniref:Succinyl-diaminopimelate desuccinylase n=1 Tax=Methyloceanibacter caenitepidi TaxID=1384459 RepID=A0A0A8K166_9HYPH|nr:succinyl-diaminopimelate desuccinylase [Methyloceanibacter caenitepidi]BAQ16237.1 N-succinyl-L,L-diaminopimelate desuccinylase [Methyloceanibacter caenitepidi]
MSSPADNAVAIAQSLIRCPSVTPVDAGALDALARPLVAAGFACDRLTFTEDGTADVDNLVARIGGGAPHLCFAGHTDVVPPGDETSWAHAPFSAEIADGRLYGRGASDMKGAVACFAAAAIDYVAERGGQVPGTISLLITGDEEGTAINGTKKVLAWMEEANLVPDHCLVGEPSNPSVLGETIKIGRRGSLTGHLTVTGQQGHVAYPHLAANPVKGIVTALAKLYATPLDTGSPHFSPSNLEVTSIDVGNPATNVIPARAEAHFNIRFNDNHEAETLKAMLHESIGAALSGTALSFSLDFAPHGDAFVTKPGALDELLAEAVTEFTGKTPVLSTDGGTSDARFIKDYCPVVEFGLTTETIHKTDENAVLADLETLTAIYRRFIARYFETFGNANER